MLATLGPLTQSSLDMANLTLSPTTRTLSASALSCLLSIPGVSATQSHLVIPAGSEARVRFAICVEMSESLTRGAGEFTDEQVQAARRDIEAMSESATASFFAFERSLEG